MEQVQVSIPPFIDKMKEAALYPLYSTGISVLQVNVGKTCNLACKHCHVEAGPGRPESMSRETMSHCLEVLANNPIGTLDITGGAPELNPHLPWFIASAAALGKKVMVRTNLTVLEQPEYQHLPELYAQHKVEIVASLPYYTERDTDRQRGSGVFRSAITVLQKLNSLGYGQGELRLTLVYNPGGAFLPPNQKAVEADFKRELGRRYGIVFDELFTLTNVPVGRFLKFLQETGNLAGYRERLAKAFNPAAAANVMCRNLISVGWDGTLYDCDFNQMLGLACNRGVPNHIKDFDFERLRQREIVLADHCYACTAGAGSSCGGAIVSN